MNDNDQESSIGRTGHNLDEYHLIVTQSLVDGQLFHDDCMWMGWRMNGSRMQLEHRFECGMIAMDGARPRWECCIYLNIHGHTLPSMVLSPLQTYRSPYKCLL